ncbi:hypothetical protein BWI17_12005 [Betaproteobacteria bacterium GR16-43]|nr:hypothetical protein BWI17_12005 [Betaproteobacteria bacterium GR16-43]
MVLVPVGEGARGLEAVRHLVRDDRDSLLRVELVHVAPLLNRYAARWTSRAQREAWRSERSDRALDPARRLLQGAGVASNPHALAGPVAETIAEAARRLRVDEIVMSSRRQGPLERFLGGSLGPRVMARSPVPVRLVPSTARGALDRLALPAGIGAGLTALLLLDSD